MKGIKDMIKILFICYGNICRSPMAEFILKDMVKQQKLEDQFEIASAATSTEEIGNPVHPGTVNKLREYGISTAGKYAVRVNKQDYEKYDYLICMDNYNIKNLAKIFGQKTEKIYKLLQFAGSDADVDDPWYTGDFNQAYEDIVSGCKGLLNYLLESGQIKI